MRDSQYGDEWIKMQAEMNQAREELTNLSTANNDLSRTLTEKSSQLDEITRELAALREQSATEKANHQREIENMRIDRKTRDDMFRTLVNGLKEVVIGAQRELELSDFDFSFKGSTPAERIANMKNDLELIKKTVIEKLKTDKDAFKV